MRAYTHRFISFAVQCAVITLLALGLSFSAGHSLAQDVPTETPAPSDAATVAPTDVPTELPTVVPTDVPTEIPTVVPTDVPTEQPTAASTDIPTDVPSDLPTDVAPTEATTEQPTAAATDVTAVPVEPTEAVIQAPVTPDISKLFIEDFQDGETTGWLLTAGWTVADDAGNAVLTTSAPNEVATLTAVTWPYFTLSFRVRGTIQLNMAAGGSNYQIKVAADGAVFLFKDGALLAQSAGEVPTEGTVEPSNNWHTVNLLAPGNLLAVKVDDFAPISTSDATLIGMGPILFSTAADNTTSAAFDDLSMQHLDVPPPVPTAFPTASGVVPIPSPMNVTAEPTVEQTVEATIEATQEATAEATVEATQEATAEATVEATQEATAEATVEATVEATAEATPEALSLEEAARIKLSPELLGILESYIAGDIEGARAAAADYFITVDNQQRINVTVWTSDEQASAKVAGDITTAGGVVIDAFSIRLQVSVTLEGLVALVNAPEVTLIEVPPKAVSTSDMEATAPTGFGSGTEISEGVDTSGAAAWQSAGIKGAGVGIALIDTGFGASVVPASGEYACLGNTGLLSGLQRAAGDTTHGLTMVEVLCDMAPAAKVYMYKASDATTLANAITYAKNNTNFNGTITPNPAIKIIVIGMDLGSSVSPGDGTGGGPTYGVDGLYSAISLARAAGKVVIASAGNNTGRYVTLNYSNVGTTTVPMTVYGGDVIHVSWNDWSSSAQNLDLSISGVGITTTDFSVNGGNAPRPGAPRAFTTIPAGNCAAGCNINLSVSGGAAPLVVQVQVAGEGTIDGGSVTGSTVASTTGNLARPADSPDLIAVGAVCNNSDVLQDIGNLNGTPAGSIRLLRDTFSSQGPVFGTGGTLPTTSLSYTRDQVKPDLMGISHLSVSGNQVNLAAPNTCDTQATGFNGTSGAAASVAGMTALLLSNTGNAVMAARFATATASTVDNIQNYLQTHTIDDTTVASNAVGYNMLYGAGLTVLGNPTYNLNLIVTPANPANLLPASCSANAPLYVGLANAGSSQVGTLANPFISISEAMAKAIAAQCVVILPGEYVSPIASYAAVNAPSVIAYQVASTSSASASSLWSVFLPPISIIADDVTVDGFVARTATMLNYPDSTGTTVRTAPLYISGGVGATIQNSDFSAYKIAGLIVGSSNNVTLKDNSFSNFIIPVENLAGGTIVRPLNGVATSTLEIKNSTNILLTGNIFVGNSIPNTNQNINPWQPAVVGIRYSSVNLYNNRFTSNTSAAVVGIDQWQVGPGTSSLQTAEVRFVGNLFVANIITGPLVHAFAAPNMRFVNNSVISNSMNGTGTLNLDGSNSGSRYNGYFIYGVEASVFGNIDGSFEIHNNLFFNNINSAGTVRPLLLETAENQVNIGCDPINGGAPVRNNWFDAPIGLNALTNTQAGECSGAGKITGSIDEPLTAASFFGTATDPVDPYRLRPTDPNITNLKSGINTGDNAALINIFGSPAYTQQFDIRGEGRVVLGSNPNPLYSNPPAVVDIGAYELGLPTAPQAVSLTPSAVAEDSTKSIVFKLKATGGYIQAFSITSLPSAYDPTPTNDCNGLPVLFKAPNTVIYCPPANFHTEYGPANSDVPVTIGFSVEDPVFKPGEISTGTITQSITPVDDGQPVVPTLNVLSDYFTPINQQLTPAYQTSPFVLTGSGTNVDFPFTYAFVSQTGTDNANLLATGGNTTVQVLQAALAAASSNGGKLIINPVAGQQGYFSFTYSITDHDGPAVNGNATIVILPTLAREGNYDDASFNFTYTHNPSGANNWKPSFLPGAYNNTLHSTTTNADAIEFPFTGSIVRFNMRGSSVGGINTNVLKLEFKINIGNGGVIYQDYPTTKAAVPALSCIDSLKGAPVGTNTANYSPTNAAYNITCSGLPTDQVHSVRLSLNPLAGVTGTTMTLDSADVSAGVMTAGKSYQETSPNITFGSGWLKGPNASMLGGAWAYTNVSNATATFKIDSSVGRIIFYRTTYLAGVYGSMQVSVDGVLAATISNVSSTFLTQQSYLLTIASPGNHTITVKNVGATYSSIDQITTLSAAQNIPLGTYQESYPDLTYTGTWINAANAAMFGNGFTYTNDPNAAVSFKIDGTVSRVVIYRTTYLAGVYGSMNVFLDTNLTTPIATINNTSATYLYKQPYVLNIASPGNHTITLKNVGTTYSSLDQISLLPDTLRLTTTPGTYQETDLNLTYTGTWTSNINGAALGGSRIFTNQNGASVSFKINGSVERVMIYHTTYKAGVYGAMNVYLDTNMTTPIATINTSSAAFVYGVPFLVNIPVPGNHTITIKNVGTTYSDLDQITLLGATQRLKTTSPGGTIQETDFNLTYTGTWTSNINAAAFGGSRIYTNQNGASVSFKIDSSVERVVIYHSSYLAGSYGAMNVFLDTNMVTPIATISNTSSAFLYRQPYLISIASPGDHTITIKNVGTTYSDIDQISLLGAPARLSTGTYQDTDLNLKFSGLWTNNINAAALGGSRIYTNTNGGSVSFDIDINVERIFIYHTTYLSSVYGSMEVYIDTNPTPIATIDNFPSSTLVYGVRADVIDITSPGDHTITIKNVGTKFSDIDQISLLPAAAPLSAGPLGTIYQEDYPDITYTGAWTSSLSPVALGGSRKFTNQNGANVSFDIDASVSRVIVYRTIYKAGVYGSMQVFIDANPTPIATINNNTSASFLYGQPFIVNIASPGTHTITIKNVGTTYSDLDQIKLLGPGQRLTTSTSGGIIQETDPNLVYTGAWTSNINGSALGGSRIYTNQNGASIVFNIDASVARMIIYRTTYLSGVYGSMNVFLDTNMTTPIATISNTSAAFMYAQPFFLNIASPGNHTITIKNVGSTYSDIDQITLLGPRSRLTTTTPGGTIQETDTNLTYTGTWTPNINGAALGGSRIFTNQNGASVSFDIDASVSRVVVYRTTYKAGVYGSMNVFLDTNMTTPIATINNSTSPAFMYGQPFVVNIASPGNHTITIKNVGTTYSDIDQITLLGTRDRLTITTPGTLQETNLNLTYTGTWTTNINGAALGGSRIYTNQNGASVSFDIDSSVTRMIIYRTTYLTGVYGSMNVFLDTNLTTPIATISNTSSTFMYAQPFFVNIALPGNHTITLKNVGTTYSDIDQITLLGPTNPISVVDFYEESNTDFAYTGAWTRVTGIGPSGNQAYSTYTQGATIKFQVTGTAFSIYRALVPGAGNFTVRIDGGAAQTFTNNSTSVLWKQGIDFSGLTNTTHDVLITKSSPATDFIYFDGVRVIDTTAALTVGQYQNTYPGLTYTGAWTVGGVSTFTTTNGNYLEFKFTGTGFGFVTTNPSATATMSVSCVISGGSNVCANPSPVPANGGYAFYNLKQGTYDVTITYTGTGTGGLQIDRVFVLDTPPTVLQPGTYEESNAAIVYSPSDLWTTGATASYSGGTARFTTQKGAVMQVRFNGNSLVIYQLAYASGASNLNLCVFLTDAAGNPTSVCSTYSQNTATTNFTAPVAFYGFGSGTHEVIVENRSQGLQFAVDKILVN